MHCQQTGNIIYLSSAIKAKSSKQSAMFAPYSREIYNIFRQSICMQKSFYISPKYFLPHVCFSSRAYSVEQLCFILFYYPCCHMEAFLFSYPSCLFLLIIHNTLGCTLRLRVRKQLEIILLQFVAACEMVSRGECRVLVLTFLAFVTWHNGRPGQHCPLLSTSNHYLVN